jgi:hypothetical protein
MPRAAFEDEPQASAAAIALRELGFTAEVTSRSGSDTYDERARSLLTGNPPPFEVHAILTSDADTDRFVRIVERHHGFPVSS